MKQGKSAKHKPEGLDLARELFNQAVMDPHMAEFSLKSGLKNLDRVQKILLKESGGKEIPEQMYKKTLGVSGAVFLKLHQVYGLAALLPAVMHANGTRIRELEDRINPPGKIGGLYDYAYGT